MSSFSRGLGQGVGQGLGIVIVVVIFFVLIVLLVYYAIKTGVAREVGMDMIKNAIGI